MQDLVRVFQIKLSLGGPDTPRQTLSLSHLPVIQWYCTVIVPFVTEVHANKTNTVKVKFSRRLVDFDTQKHSQLRQMRCTSTPWMQQQCLHAARNMSVFGSSYLCKQMFSIMKLTSHRSCVTDQHLFSVLKVAMAKDIVKIVHAL